MPRPRKTPAATTPDAPESAETTTPAPEGETPVRRRRRRRTPAMLAAETATETTSLVEAVLRSRGAKGATQEALQSVIGWAREVRAEGDTLKELAGRPRRQKTQAPADRIARYEMNRALLDGVLSGGILLDLRDDGSFIFLHREAAASSAPGAPVAEAPIEYPEGD